MPVAQCYGGNVPDTLLLHCGPRAHRNWPVVHTVHYAASLAPVLQGDHLEGLAQVVGSHIHAHWCSQDTTRADIVQAVHHCVVLPGAKQEPLTVSEG